MTSNTNKFISDLRFAVICRSNINRSTEVHQQLLSKNGFYVVSYGTGKMLCLPGESMHKSNKYDFDVSYYEIYNNLSKINKEFYTKIGLLNVIDRNRRIKRAPERFQNSNKKFDIVITCEETVYDAVLKHVENRAGTDYSILHIININVIDNFEEATIASFTIKKLCSMLVECKDIDNEIEEILNKFEDSSGRTAMHAIAFK